MKMNALDWFAQVVLSALFVLDGFIRVLGYRRSSKPQSAWPWFTFIRLPFEGAVLIALAEMAGVAALWVPADVWPPQILPRLAAAALGLLAVAGGVYHVRRKEPSALNLALSMLALMVVVGRWP